MWRDDCNPNPFGFTAWDDQARNSDYDPDNVVADDDDGYADYLYDLYNNK